MKKSKIEKLRIHKQHLFIKAVAWLTILTFLITLLFMGFPIISNAESLYIKDDFYCFDLLTYDGFISHNNENGYYSIPDGNKILVENLSPFINNSYDYSNDLESFFDLPLSSFTQLYTDFYFFVDINTNNFYVATVRNGSLFVNYNVNNNDLPFYGNGAVSLYSFDGSNLNFISNTGNNLWIKFNNSDYMYTNRFKLLYSSCPFYISINSNININYLNIENKQGKGQGGFNVPDADSSILDNMFLYGGGVALSSNGCQDGTLYIAALPTKSQVSDGYKVRISADGNYTFRIENGYSYFLDGYDMVKKYGLSLDSNNSVNFNLRSNKGNYVEFSFSDFQHGLLTLDLNSDILSNCYTSGIDSNILDLSKYLFQNSNFWSKATQPISNYITQSKSVGIGDYTVTLPDYINSTADEPKLVITNCKVVYTMYIVSPDGSQTSDGSMVFISDMLDSSNSQIALDNLTKTPEEVADKTTTENYNKYEPEYPINVPQNITNPSAPSNSDSNSSSDSSNSNNVQISSGDNSPVFNNNVVLDSKPLPSGFINNLLTLIHGEKNTDIELLENTSGISGVMYLFEVSMSWIPPEVINIWTTFLKATLGICVGAFFLKILVNWST